MLHLNKRKYRVKISRQQQQLFQVFLICYNSSTFFLPFYIILTLRFLDLFCFESLKGEVHKLLLLIIIASCYPSYIFKKFMRFSVHYPFSYYNIIWFLRFAYHEHKWTIEMNIHVYYICKYIYIFNFLSAPVEVYNKIRSKGTHRIAEVYYWRYSIYFKYIKDIWNKFDFHLISNYIIMKNSVELLITKLKNTAVELQILFNKPFASWIPVSFFLLIIGYGIHKPIHNFKQMSLKHLKIVIILKIFWNYKIYWNIYFFYRTVNKTNHVNFLKGNFSINLTSIYFMGTIFLVLKCTIFSCLLKFTNIGWWSSMRI